MNQSLEKTILRYSLNLQSLCSHQFKHFSFLCRRSSVICFGVNKPHKTHPLSHKFGYRFASIHSELSCILNFPHKPGELWKYFIVNVRLNKYGKLRMSKPCHQCSKLLESFGISEIYYSTDKGFKNDR